MIQGLWRIRSICPGPTESYSLLFSVSPESEPGRVHHLGPYELRLLLGLANGRCQQDLRGQEGSKVMELIPLTAS